MAMTLTSRRELYKLREIVHFLLAGGGGSRRKILDSNKPPIEGAYVCYFCEEEMHDLDFVTHGNTTGPKFDCAVSIHHINGNHDDNEMSNKALCHTTCHKSYHRSIANAQRAARRREESV